MVRHLTTISRDVLKGFNEISELYNQTNHIYMKCVEDFFELVFRLCEKYNLKIVVNTERYSFEEKELEYIVFDDESKATEISDEGDVRFFRAIFVGKLSLKSINEIRNTLKATHQDSWNEKNGMYSYYGFAYYEGWMSDISGV